MKKLTIILLFFIILNSFNNVFASSDSIISPYIFSGGSRAKSLVLSVKTHILGYCKCVVQRDYGEIFMQEAQNIINNNKDNPEFRREMTEEFNTMKEEFGKENYVFRPGDDMSSDINIRISYTIHKFENLLNSNE